MKKTKSDAERFAEKIAPEPMSGCWLWAGTTSNNGYGTFRAGSLTDGSRRNVSAHRFALEMAVGEIPLGMQALHHCDNKLCVNPEHLYAGSHADNMRDAKARGRTGGRPMPGETNPNAKLKTQDVLAIRASDAPTKLLAAKYGVSSTHIHWIKNYSSWSHV